MNDELARRLIDVIQNLIDFVRKQDYHIQSIVSEQTAMRDGITQLLRGRGESTGYEVARQAAAEIAQLKEIFRAIDDRPEHREEAA
jgi:hypothetical protein